MILEMETNLYTSRNIQMPTYQPDPIEAAPVTFTVK